MLPIADKFTRVAAHSASIEAGHVHIPIEAAWLADFEVEMMQFPAGRHDDQVDGLSQFLTWAEERRRHVVVMRELIL